MSGGDQTSDSYSDTTGRRSSLGSREDLVEVAQTLGIRDLGMLYVDRFVVDRRRLEDLIYGEGNSAEDFFNNIMFNTNTRIAWPSRLKLGAKTRRDPHVKVMGLEEDVETAKSKVLAVLQLKCTRVTLKIDVSYTDHSHIIGREGLTIKGIMEETQCHIHFPDSNKTNTTEKSNQVSISGTVRGIERARAGVRKFTPLIFCFDLPVVPPFMGKFEPRGDPIVQNFEEKFNVKVMVRSRQKLNSTLVVVKGNEWEVDTVKEAIQLLIRHTCDHLANQVNVYMMLEISPQHQHIVLGEKHRTLKSIMHRTNTQIIFVDPLDQNIPKIKRSNVTITGSIHNVYLARQQLIGCLPVVLMFDVPESAIVIDNDKIEALKNDLDVYINYRNKYRQNYISFIIKGLERNVFSVYEARRQLLDSDEIVCVDIPQTYVFPNSESFKTNYIPSPTINVSSPLTGPSAQVGTAFGFPWPAPNDPPSPQPVTALPALPPVAQLSPHLHHLRDLSPQPQPYYYQLGRRGATVRKDVSPLSPNILQQHHQVIKNISPDSQIPNREGTPERGAWRSPERNPSDTTTDYQQLRIQALNAVQRGVGPEEVRIPTTFWSGLSFSQSSPHTTTTTTARGELNTVEDEGVFRSWRDAVGDDASVFPMSVSNITEMMSVSNMKEMVSSPMTSRPYHGEELHTLLTRIGCDKYYIAFARERITLEMFKNMTEMDLKHIGVKGYSARQKMLLCITELNRAWQYNGSAAPGAERRDFHRRH